MLDARPPRLDHRPLGKAGRAGTPRSERTLALGMFAYEGEPEVLAQMLSSAPAPVRWVIVRLARRVFARRARALYGTPTP